MKNLFSNKIAWEPFKSINTFRTPCSKKRSFYLFVPLWEWFSTAKLQLMMFGKGFQQKTLTKEVEFQFRVSNLKYKMAYHNFGAKFLWNVSTKRINTICICIVNWWSGFVCAIWENYKLHGLYVKQPDILTDSIWVKRREGKVVLEGWCSKLGKVQILWEGHKIWKNLQTLFEITY